jgi:hypothetical protein
LVRGGSAGNLALAPHLSNCRWPPSPGLMPRPPRRCST